MDITYYQGPGMGRDVHIFQNFLYSRQVILYTDPGYGLSKMKDIVPVYTFDYTTPLYGFSLLFPLRYHYPPVISMKKF
jgi:hypothetical protein